MEIISREEECFDQMEIISPWLKQRCVLFGARSGGGGMSSRKNWSIHRQFFLSEKSERRKNLS